MRNQSETWAEFNSIGSLRDAMAANGITPQGQIILDGTFHRFRVEGDPRHDPSGWCKGYSDGIPNAIYGSFRHSSSHKWIARHVAEPTADQRRAFEVAARQQKAATEKRVGNAAERAQKMWDEAMPAPGDHPYLARKQVPSLGLRCGLWRDVPNTLYVPIRNSRQQIVSLQGIFPEVVYGRGKEFLKDGQKKGGYFVLDGASRHGERPVIVISEGYATAASVHLATGFCTVVAFDCGNLLDVAKTVRRTFPAGVILIAGDNDQWSPRNAGLIAAREAASAVSGQWVMPKFSVTDTNPTDFNDLQVLAGRDVVHEQVLAVLKQDAGCPVPLGPM